MNTTQRIAKNTILLLISQVAHLLFFFLFTAYSTRYLGPERFGIISFALAFTGIFTVLADFGLTTLALREIARDKSKASKYIGNGLIIKACLSIITFIIISAVINLLRYPSQMIIIVYVIALYLIITSFNGLFNSVFQAFEKVEYQSLGQIINSVLMLIGTLFMISKNLDAIAFASVYLIASLITLVYNLVICVWKFISPDFSLDFEFARSVIKEAIPFGLSISIITIYYCIGTVMMSIMVPNSEEAIGWYNAAYKLVVILLTIPSVYFFAIFPIMSRLHISSQDRLNFTFERSFKYMAMLAFPISVGTTLLARDIIKLTFGSDFIGGTIALQILVWSSLFIFLSQPFGWLVDSTNRQIIETKIASLGALLNIVLNLFLIPKYGYIAASATTVTTELCILLMYFIAVHRIGFKLNSSFMFNAVSRPIIASIMMGIFIISYSINNNNNNILLLVCISSIIYFAVLYIVNGSDNIDIHILNRLIGKEG